MQTQLAYLVGFFLISGDACAGEPAWRYVAKAESDSPIRPVFRFVTLSSKKPDDLGEEVH